MWRLLILTLLFSICAGGVSALASTKQDRRQNGVSPRFDATSFDYDFGVQSRRAAWRYQKSTPTTTERPIIRYWNNFVRNVRLPIPTITWNMSSPLLNLFNAGGTNALESPVGPFHTETKRRRKNTRRQSSIVVKRTRKRKRPQKHYEEEPEQQTGDAEEEQPTYNTDFDPNKPLYFYDPTSDQYYEMQRLQSEYMSNNYQDEQTEVPPDQVVNSAEVEDGAASDADNSKERQNSHSADEDVVVVSKLDPNEGDSNPTNDENSVKNDESLRNVIGSFMSDDRLNRKRQRNNPKIEGTKQNVGHSRPRNTIRYYFLEPV